MSETVLVEPKLLKGNASLQGNSRFRTDCRETQKNRIRTQIIDFIPKTTLLVYETSNPTYAFSKSILSEEIDTEKITNGFIHVVIPNRNKHTFADVLWDNVTSLFSKNKEESALYFLFKTLNDELLNPSNCDLFLAKLMVNRINSDVIVHVINALKPIKLKLKNWDSFVSHSSQLLIDELGEKNAKIILNAIV